MYLGFFSSFLECKLFVVISRISYVVYLMHLIVQLQSIGQIRQPFYGNYWSLVRYNFVRNYKTEKEKYLLQI